MVKRKDGNKTKIISDCFQILQYFMMKTTFSLQSTGLGFFPSPLYLPCPMAYFCSWGQQPLTEPQLAPRNYVPGISKEDGRFCSKNYISHGRETESVGDYFHIKKTLRTSRKLHRWPISTWKHVHHRLPWGKSKSKAWDATFRLTRTDTFKKDKLSFWNNKCDFK